MELEKLKHTMLDRLGVTEETPFGPELFVYKVKGKMFSVIAWQDQPIRINLKCDPDKALALRDMFESIIPGYHMNKKHWNTIILDGDVPEAEICSLIDHSYELVVKGLKKADRVALGFDT